MTIHKQHLLCGLTALSLIAPFAGFASPAAFENGFYFGAKIGAQHAMASWEQSSRLIFEDLEFDVLGEINSPDQHGQTFHTNLMGNIGLGYGRVMDKFFLAAELSVNLSEEQEFGWQDTQTVNLDTVSGSLIVDSGTLYTNTQVELENPDIIFDLRPGWLLATNFLLYGRVGVAYNELSIEQNSSVNLHDLAGFVDMINASSSDEKDVYAWRLGVGMEYKFTHNLALNIDYVFADYGNIDTELFKLDDTIVPNDPFLSETQVSSSADVTKSTATAGFNWYFGGKKPRPAYHGPDK